MAQAVWPTHDSSKLKKLGLLRAGGRGTHSTAKFAARRDTSWRPKKSKQSIWCHKCTRTRSIPGAIAGACSLACTRYLVGTWRVPTLRQPSHFARGTPGVRQRYARGTPEVRQRYARGTPEVRPIQTSAVRTRATSRRARGGRRRGRGERSKLESNDTARLGSARLLPHGLLTSYVGEIPHKSDREFTSLLSSTLHPAPATLQRRLSLFCPP